MSKEQEATFAINLQDNTSGKAESAAQAMDTLRDAITRDTKALSEMQRAMRRLQSGTSVNIAQFRSLQSQIEGKKNAIAQAQGALVDLGGSFERTKKPGSGFGAMLDKMRAQAQGVGGPLGGVAGKLGSLKSLLAGGALSLGVVALVGALALLAAASIGATAALLTYGIAQANARRSELLRLEGLTKLRSIYGLAAGSAKEMQQAIDRASGSTALGRDQVGGFAEELYRAGLRGQNLTDALEAMSIKAATQGDAAAKKWAGFASAIALSGGSVKKLADDVKARLGGIAAAQLLDLDVQARKLRESFSSLFRDLKIEGLLKGLKSVADLFSQSTVSGRALKTLAEVVLQPMIGALEVLMPLAKRFFQGMILGAQFVVIQVLRVALFFKNIFGGSILKDVDLTNVALYAGVAAVGALAAAFVVMGGLVIGALVAAMPFIWAAVTAVSALAMQGLILAAPFILGAVAIGALVAAGYQLYQLWKEIDWTSLGKAIVDGIVGGLKNGANFVKDAVRSLGEDAWGAFKTKLGIASPSKEFAKLGRALPQGVEAGIDAGSPELERTVGEMVSTPTAPQPSGAPAASGGARGLSIRIDQLLVQATGTTAQSIAKDIRGALEDVLEGLATQMGARA